MIDELCKKIHNHLMSINDYYEGCFELLNQNNYNTMWFCKIAVIRFYDNGDNKKIGVSNKFISTFKLDQDVEIIKSEAAWTIIKFTDTVCKKIFSNFIPVFNNCYKESAVDVFGCCSRYIQCSDAKLCVHSDKKEARGCMYKVNLDNGRIFYGKNRNI